MADAPEIPCLSFDLSDIAGIAGAKQLQANFRDLRDFSKKLSLYLEAAADAVQGDDVWTERTADVIGHIQTRTEADGVAAVPEEAAGLGGQFITNLMVDPMRHGIVTQRASAHVADVHADDAWIVVAADHGVGHGPVGASTGAKALNGFAWNVQLDGRNHVADCNGGAIYGDTNWIGVTWDALGHYDFAHLATGPVDGTAGLGGASALLQTITRDVNHHVKGATSATGDSWLVITSGAIKHTATTTTAGSAAAGAGSAISTIYLDAAKHVVGIVGTTISGVAYSADGTWIQLSGSTFSHIGPSSATASAGGTGTGLLVGFISWDVKGHTVTGSTKTITGSTWISVTDAAGVITIAHTATAGATATSYGSAGQHLIITTDANGHVISGSSS